MWQYSSLGFFLISSITGSSTLPGGHFYVIGIQTTNEIGGLPGQCLNGGYENSSRLVYIAPDASTGGNYDANSTTLGDSVNTWDVRDIIARDTLNLYRTTILPTIEDVIAATAIHVKKTSPLGNADPGTIGSHLKGGHYFISSDVCDKASARESSNPSNKPKGVINSGTNGNITISNATQPIYYQSTSSSNNTKANTPSFTIYPNPTNNNAIVEFTNMPKVNNPVIVTIYNSLGQPVSSETSNLSLRYLNLNIGELSPGLYNIIITQGSKTWNSKVVKQ